MFRFVSFFAIVLACAKNSLGSNLHSAPLASSVISSGYATGYGAGYGTGYGTGYGIGYGYNGALANSGIHSGHHGAPAHSTVSSYSSSVVHPSSSVLHSGLGSSFSAGHYGPSSLGHQAYSSPLVSGGVYGHGGGHATSYAVQRSYNGPLAAAGHGLYGGSIVNGGYGAHLGQGYGYGHGLNAGPILAGGYGTHGHLSGW